MCRLVEMEMDAEAMCTTCTEEFAVYLCHCHVRFDLHNEKMSASKCCNFKRETYRSRTGSAVEIATIAYDPPRVISNYPMSSSSCFVNERYLHIYSPDGRADAAC